MFIDESVMEIFISDGEYTMTSRFYDNEKDLFVRFEGINEIETYKMKGFKIE
ncbi:MAG: GH32 C-terminal domain-containing protein [Holdemanella porci]